MLAVFCRELPFLLVDLVDGKEGVAAARAAAAVVTAVVAVEDEDDEEETEVEVVGMVFPLLLDRVLLEVLFPLLADLPPCLVLEPSRLPQIKRAESTENISVPPMFNPSSSDGSKPKDPRNHQKHKQNLNSDQGSLPVTI